ncbi:MAG: FAD-dependent oxidoreductase [Verrucomicrobia bacterium]|nr:FAD-dependent oxidoreductase [Verrucomicrobiota bacterium]
MAAPILIVGQGLAGTLLAWELEVAGLPFEIADAGHGVAASRVAAGIVNPVTGRRLVESWRVAELRPLARDAYGRIESRLGRKLWHEMRVRRRFADERERRVFHEKRARGELAPWAGLADDDGFWIEGAARVDLPVLLSAAREHWRASGRLCEAACDWTAEISRRELVIDCAGRGTAAFGFVPWERSRGEVLLVETTGLEPGVILNRRHWVCPLDERTALVGATHEPGCDSPETSAVGRARLEESAADLLARPFAVREQWAGVRVQLPDRRPAAGRHPAQPALGVLNGLGSKGVLLAPWLARQWVDHLRSGVGFDPTVDCRRFAS